MTWSAAVRVENALDVILASYPMGATTIRMEQGVPLRPVDLRKIVSGNDGDGRATDAVKAFLAVDDRDVVFETPARVQRADGSTIGCRITRADLIYLTT